MAEFIANPPQTVAVAGNVVFETTMVKPCPLVTHRDDSGIFTLHGGRSYLVIFSANVSGATAGTELDLSLAIAGEEVLASRMASTPDGANDWNNVNTAIYVKVPCNCCYTVSIKNTGTTDVIVGNANLIIIKEE